MLHVTWWVSLKMWIGLTDCYIWNINHINVISLEWLYVCVLVYILCLFDIVAVLYSHNTDSPSFPLLTSFPSFFSKNGYWEPIVGIFKIAFALILKLISWLLPGITTIKKKEDLLLLSKSQDHQILSFLNVLLPLGHCICHYPHPVISVSSY